MSPTPANEFDSPPLFPLFTDLRSRAVLVVGGGTVARRKADAVLESGAEVTVVAPALHPELHRLVMLGRVRHRAESFTATHVDGAWLVIAAAVDEAINRSVAEAANARGIFINVVDDAEHSSVHFPARVRRGRLQVAVSSGGSAPVLARRVRERLELALDDSLAALADLFARERARIRRRVPQIGTRRRFFENVMDGDVPRLLRAGRVTDANAIFERTLDADIASPCVGSVALVGAGPGDPGLLTLKALRALQDADVILHDRLVGSGILELARRDAERIDVGKRVGENQDATQARIHALMLEHARAGKRVVRLQGGDPLIFGRGGEELEFLREHAITFEVIPGITAALACAAAAGVALTDRRHARSVTLLSPRGRTSIDDAALAAPGQTLAIYMGMGELESLVQSLIAHGRALDTPCVLVASGSLPGQRIVTATLAGMPARVRAEAIRAPALLIVGEVAAQAQRALRADRCHSRLTHLTPKAA